MGFEFDQEVSDYGDYYDDDYDNYYNQVDQTYSDHSMSLLTYQEYSEMLVEKNANSNFKHTTKSSR